MKGTRLAGVHRYWAAPVRRAYFWAVPAIKPSNPHHPNRRVPARRPAPAPVPVPVSSPVSRCTARHDTNGHLILGNNHLHLVTSEGAMVEFDPYLPSGWDHNHRAFLQALMSRGTLTFREAQPIVAAILTAADEQGRRSSPGDITEDMVRHFVGKAREAVAPLDYDIRSTYHQMTKELVWALINAHSDPSTQLATSRTPDEIAFIKRVLDAMFETYNTQRQEVMAVTAAQARKVARPPARESRNAAEEDDEPQPQQAADRGLKHSEVERLLPSLVEEGWFESSQDGFYSLSPRSLMELKTWLLEAYNDPDAGPEDWQRIKFCEACKEIVTVGQRCPARDCNTRLHDICADAFWRTRRGGQKQCPKCQTQWTGQNFVGERSVTETAAAHRRPGRANGSRRSTVNGSLVNGVADEDVEEEDEDAGEA